MSSPSRLQKQAWQKPLHTVLERNADEWILGGMETGERKLRGEDAGEGAHQEENKLE